ncbi:hypothetical protein PR003_g14435 [Phytophthora rubi]|uniref:Reverse transcriptase domain-containing protein n=1 Tax=Phytophthora rubi TaxID=129364 RepID=A0A6A4F2Q5_9STRA|nr:hypothetical protein PR003_g14435 [Phytophthora rubi]
MPVGASIESKTKRMIARYEFNCSPERISEEQWITNFKQANEPSHVVVDEAMKQLRMQTKWPEPESRMMNLQADLEAILDPFNLAELAFEHEQRRLVRYLTNALEPASFRSVVATRLALQENKKFKNEVVPFCAWVKVLLKEFMTWEQAANSVSSTPAPHGSTPSSSGRRGGRGGASNSANGGGRSGGNGGGRGGGSHGGRGGNGTAPATTFPARAGGAEGAPAPRRRGACHKCQSTQHQVRECPNIRPGEASELLQALRARRESAPPTSMLRLQVADDASEDLKLERTQDAGTVDATVDGLEVKALLLDSGADTSLVARGVIDALQDDGVLVHIRQVADQELKPVGSGQLVASQVVQFKEVMLATSAGPLMLRNLECFVDESDPSHGLIVGRPIMKILGYSTDELLVRARDAQTEWELAGADDTTAPTAEGTTPLQRVCRLQAAAMETSAPSVAASEDVERYETRTAFPTVAPEVLADLIRTLEQRFKVSTEMGLVLEPQARLKAILRTRQDVFRLQFGDDPPVRVAPLQVRLKPGVTPTKSQPRRYSPDDRAFIERHVDALLQHSLVFRNPRSRWASVPRIVRKKEQDHDPLADPRMTVDTRAVNERTEAMPWPMPVLEVVIGELEGAHVFFVLDWFRGNWQLPLHPDSQEYFTFVTHRGMYTPTRVPMGATDAVAYCQGVVEEIFGDLLGNGILCWLDDILGYAADATALMELLDKVLARCEKYGLKLHAKKCQFIATDVKWCGKLISTQKVRHCPERRIASGRSRGCHAFVLDRRST